jgi:FlaA1/EpsC-like NDP-sugar epimerase
LKTLARARWTFLDLVTWQFAGFLSLIFRFDRLPSFQVLQNSASLTLVLAVSFRFLLLLDRRFFGTYRKFSIDELVSFLRTFLVVTVLGTAPLVLLGGVFLPRSFVFLTTSIAAGLMLLSRLVARQLIRANSAKGLSKSALIYGAGFYSEMVIRQLLEQPDAKWRVSGVIDDDPKKFKLRINGVKVIGDTNSLEKLVVRLKPDAVIIAIANIGSTKLQFIDEIARRQNIEVHIVPTISALIGKKFSISDLKPLDEEDIIGRKLISADVTQLEDYFKGKRVLVTGAGGSIGSELVRQINSLEPAYLGLLDRDESGILSTQLSLDNQGLLSASNLILADIRDRIRLEEIFSSVKPEIVFHAAALKHLPLLESNPSEAWKTNVLGTLNVVEVSKQYKVDTFVNISTDKAADPVSVLGHSKFMTEQIALYFGERDKDFKCTSVRFGNVFGSRGSVIGTFNHQINAGGPVTVTDPEVTRYFMTIHEAVHLVLRSSILGENGETLILDMGAPVKILDVARKLILRSGKKIDIEFSGLRKGEKVHEELFSDSEIVLETSDPMISKTRVQALSNVEIEFLMKEFSTRTNSEEK